MEDQRHLSGCTNNSFSKPKAFHLPWFSAASYFLCCCVCCSHHHVPGDNKDQLTVLPLSITAEIQQVKWVFNYPAVIPSPQNDCFSILAGNCSPCLLQILIYLTSSASYVDFQHLQKYYVEGENNSHINCSGMIRNSNSSCKLRQNKDFTLITEGMAITP